MQLAIEAASDEPGVALSDGGAVRLSMTWQTQRNHSVELMPAIERLLAEAQLSKSDISGVLVDTGPGGYAALRVGVSTAKALAHGLGVPIAGVGRLELDAALVAVDAGERRIVAVHRAGRGEIASAAYRIAGGVWREEAPPAIAKSPAFHATLVAGDIVTGDIDDELAKAMMSAGASAASPRGHRVEALASLGARRLLDGRADDAGVLVPLYLRAPAIGPQA